MDEAPAGSPLGGYRGRIASPLVEATDQAGGLSGELGGASDAIDGFSPDARGAERDRSDLLFTTDALAPSVRLQQASVAIAYDVSWRPDTAMERIRRLARAGSPHDRIGFEMCWPAEGAGALIGVVNGLTARTDQLYHDRSEDETLPHEVYPEPAWIGPDLEQTIAATRELFTHVGDAQANPDAWRHQLSRAPRDGAWEGARALPYGSGSGVRNPAVAGRGYVFVARVPGISRAVLRYVPVDAGWRVRGIGAVADAFTCLTVADLRGGTGEFSMSEDAFEGVYDAWRVAQRSVFDTWEARATPTPVAPPRAFNDARALLDLTTRGIAVPLRARLRSQLIGSPTVEIARGVRRLLSRPGTPLERIHRIADYLDEQGVPPVARAIPAPPAALERVRLVAWLAVEGRELRGAGQLPPEARGGARN